MYSEGVGWHWSEPTKATVHLQALWFSPPKMFSFIYFWNFLSFCSIRSQSPRQHQWKPTVAGSASPMLMWLTLVCVDSPSRVLFSRPVIPLPVKTRASLHLPSASQVNTQPTFSSLCGRVCTEAGPLYPPRKLWRKIPIRVQIFTELSDGIMVTGFQHKAKQKSLRTENRQQKLCYFWTKNEKVEPRSFYSYLGLVCVLLFASKLCHFVYAGPHLKLSPNLLKKCCWISRRNNDPARFLCRLRLFSGLLMRILRCWQLKSRWHSSDWELLKGISPQLLSN